MQVGKINSYDPGDRENGPRLEAERETTLAGAMIVILDGFRDGGVDPESGIANHAIAYMTMAEWGFVIALAQR